MILVNFAIGEASMRNHPPKAGRARSLLMSTCTGALLALGSFCLLPAAHATPFIGEVICGGWNFCPAGWGECNGALVPISENETLFNLIGTTYGGDGQSTFALPNLLGRTMVHVGQVGAGSNRVLGEMGGTETVTLTTNQIPSHTHAMLANGGAEASASPKGKIVGVAPATAPVFATATPATTLNLAAVSSVGGSQPHDNLQPYLAVKCCISLFGVFPTPP